MHTQKISFSGVSTKHSPAPLGSNEAREGVELSAPNRKSQRFQFADSVRKVFPQFNCQ